MRYLGEKMAKIKLHKGQMEVATDKHRFKVICAGRRWGKSVLSRLIILKWAVEKQGVYFIVSPTYKQAKMIHWRDMVKEVPSAWIKKKNEVELSITLQNGSIIELKGAENPDALRGVKLRGLVIDEIASIRNWEWLWSEVLRPTLTDYAAPAIFISTPKGFNHFYELYNVGQEDDSIYRSWRFTSYDNPYIPSDEIDQSKKELTEDTFAQEYMADFRKYTGLVYKGFNREIHVLPHFDIPQSWRVYRCFDFGSTNPTVCLWVAVDNDDNWFVVDEYYRSGETLDTHSGVVNANALSKRVASSYGDPSGAQWIQEFQQRGIYITKANKEQGTSNDNWVRLGINKVGERLKRTPGHLVNMVQRPGIGTDVHDMEKGEPKLFVFARCKEAIREFETYRWKEKSVTQAQDLNEPDQPEKANDHAMDALRYFAVSHRRAPSTVAPKQWDDSQWKIGK